MADTTAAVRDAADQLACGTGPIAVDTERASGFRFDDRAWLVQLRRTGAGTHLVDPATVPDAGALMAPVMNASPWVLHAAHTDLPALTSLGWRTAQLHDTQIAGRLLGFGQIGLAGMLEEFLGVTVAKDKGREDWSARPLGTDLLTYAALDVELLTELLTTALAQLRRRSSSDGLDRLSWYRQECDRVLADWSYPVTPPDWTRLRGLGAVRDPRGLEVARRLTAVRTDVARRLDEPPEKVLRSSVIVDAARSPDRAEDIVSEVVRGRSSRTLRPLLVTGVREALGTAPDRLPERPRLPRRRPDHRRWPAECPLAARLLNGFRDAVAGLALDLGLDSSELLVSRSVRDLAWDVSQVLVAPVPTSGVSTGAPGDPVGWIEEVIGARLESYGVRDWQTDLLIPVLIPTVDTEMVRPGDDPCGD